MNEEASEPNLSLLAWPSTGLFLQGAFARLPLPRSVVLALADSRLGEDRFVADSFASAGHSVRVLAPPPSVAAAWRMVRKIDWRPVDVAARSDRLERVWLPAPLTEAGSVVAFNTLRTERSERDPIALGIWACYAHPRQRTGAAWSKERDGLTAEIALAVQPLYVLLLAPRPMITLLVIATDQITAELAGRAYLQLAGDNASEAQGPWEHPLVQRATELGLGVRLPSEIRSEVRWMGPPDPSTQAAFTDFASALLARIGVAADG